VYPVDLQAYMFSVMILAGVCIALVYDIFRAIRWAARVRKRGSGLLDLLFWAIAGAIMGAALIYGNWGEIRFYVFFGLGIGLVLYRITVGTYVLHGLRCVFVRTKLGFRRVHSSVRKGLKSIHSGLTWGVRRVQLFFPKRPPSSLHM